MLTSSRREILLLYLYETHVFEKSMYVRVSYRQSRIPRVLEVIGARGDRSCVTPYVVGG